MSAALVSVCIPVFNARSHVARAVDSILSQTHSDLELVVIDDGSTDGTWELLEDVKRKRGDSRLRLLRNAQNVGAEGNWNRCIDEARGRYFKLVCDDDWLAPECLATQVDLLDRPEHSACAMTTCLRDVTDDVERILVRRVGLAGASGLIHWEQALPWITRSGTNPIGEPVCVLMRTAAAQRAGRFNASLPYMIDLDFWVRVLRQGSLYALPERLAFFRVSASALSTQMAKDQASQVRQFMRMLRRANPELVSEVDLRLGFLRATQLNIARRILYAFARWRT